MRAAALLLLALTAGARAEEAEKEKLGTVIGIDLGTTCVSSGHCINGTSLPPVVMLSRCAGACIAELTVSGCPGSV